MFSLTCSTDATPIVALHLRPGVFEEFSLSFDLAPSIRTSKVCAVSLPYLICIAGLALSDLIGLTRLSWVNLLGCRTSAESGLLPPLCICIISQIEWFVKGFSIIFLFFLVALAQTADKP